MDSGAFQATVHRVTNSQKRLKQFSTHTHSGIWLNHSFSWGLLVFSNFYYYMIKLLLFHKVFLGNHAFIFIGLKTLSSLVIYNCLKTSVGSNQFRHQLCDFFLYKYLELLKGATFKSLNLIIGLSIYPFILFLQSCEKACKFVNVFLMIFFYCYELSISANNLLYIFHWCKCKPQKFLIVNVCIVHFFLPIYFQLFYFCVQNNASYNCYS